jgi:hypothetical protein
MTVPERSSPTPGALDEHRSLLDAGARAAGLLADACRVAPGRSSLRLEVVGDLASDIRRQLEALTGSIGKDASNVDLSVDLLVEAALRCADLANLAACNARELRPGAGATVVHLAAGVARALRVLVEAGSQDLGEEHAENSLRDVRGAGWRVDLAVRQLDGLSGGETQG